MSSIKFAILAAILVALPRVHSFDLPSPEGQQIISINHERPANDSIDESVWDWYKTKIKVNNYLQVPLQWIVVKHWINSNDDEAEKFKFNDIPAGGATPEFEVNYRSFSSDNWDITIKFNEYKEDSWTGEKQCNLQSDDQNALLNFEIRENKFYWRIPSGDCDTRISEGDLPNYAFFRVQNDMSVEIKEGWLTHTTTGRHDRVAFPLGDLRKGEITPYTVFKWSGNVLDHANDAWSMSVREKVSQGEGRKWDTEHKNCRFFDGDRGEGDTIILHDDGWRLNMASGGCDVKWD